MGSKHFLYSALGKIHTIHYLSFGIIFLQQHFLNIEAQTTMKKALSLLFTVLLVIGMTSTSSARNIYASLSGGIAWYDNSTAEQAENPNYDRDEEDSSWETSFESGLTGTVAVGCDFGDVRLEGELGYQTNDVDTRNFIDYDKGEIDDDDSESFEGTGSVSITSIMFNGYYDIPVSDSGVELFVMAGVGAVQVYWDEVGPGSYDDGSEFPENEVETFSDGAFAWQLGAGVAIPVGDDLMLDARYRYFNTTNITSDDDLEVFDDDPMNYDITSHSALVGLRYNF